MTPQENNPVSKVEPRILEQEMAESYLDYAMSVIVARALPDVRDGLKPVHRRILYSMSELGLTHAAKFRKSATVVGDVLGKYHPHGDIAVYDSLVRMAQSFAMRYRLVDGQGNFGSVDGDNAAAMRYTEARMTALAEELLTDIDKDTVNFTPNYDATRKEPVVLPAKYPNLLLNGSLGIAVGMATNIPTHNLTEVCDATIKLIDNPEATVEDLMEHIKGPDFPTGANIYDLSAIKSLYATGRGSIIMRAVAQIEESKTKGYRIIISELPYQVNKAELIIRIAQLVKEKKLEGISDIRDESDRKEGVRVVIELKANAYPKKVLNRLYELTPMQTAFHANMVALVDGILPRLLTLKDIIAEFIKHRQVVVTRRAKFDLAQAKARAHILEGLKIALDHIDAVIDTIRKSKDRPEACVQLQKKFRLTEIQANAILDMRLAALTNLERTAVDNELKEKYRLIAELETLIKDPKKVLAKINQELIEIREKYGDDRKTKIIAGTLGKFEVEDLIANEQMIVTVTRGNYIKRVPGEVYQSQGRGGKGVIGMETRQEDVIEHLATTWNHNSIYFFTNLGRVFTTKVFELPQAGRAAKGQALVNFIQLAPEEKVTTLLTPSGKSGDLSGYFFMATRKGVVKKTEVAAYANIRKSGLIAIKLNAGDELTYVGVTSGKNKIMLVSRDGQAIYFDETDVRPMGRSAAGVRGIRLREADMLISMDVVSPEHALNSELLTVLDNGYGKRTQVKYFRDQTRGGVGVKAAKITEKTGKLVIAQVITTTVGDLVLVSSQGQIIRIPVNSAKQLNRDTQGVRLMRLGGNDHVASATVIQKELEQEIPTTIAPAKVEPAKPQVVNKPKPAAKPAAKLPSKKKPTKLKGKTKSKEVNWWGKGTFTTRPT
ncbi:MAG: DNA gyrase subunit A [Patescibacteria group bacterium]